MKSFFYLSFILFSFFTVKSQTSFGLTAGYVNANAKTSDFNGDNSESESGFYAGIVLDNKISETVSIVAELSYMNADNINFLQLPIFAKIYIANSSFNVQGGFQITYTLEEVLDDFTKFNFGLGGGFGYDITEHFFVETRYIFQLNDYFKGPDTVLESKINFFNIGVGYKF